MRWAQQQRLNFISELLASQGYVNRKNLAEHFRISIPQASMDLRLYMTTYPKAMEYNLTTKRYERKPT